AIVCRRASCTILDRRVRRVDINHLLYIVLYDFAFACLVAGAHERCHRGGLLLPRRFDFRLACLIGLYIRSVRLFRRTARSPAEAGHYYVQHSTENTLIGLCVRSADNNYSTSVTTSLIDV